jgi:predicted ATP-binding protein involved in virulence
MYLKNIHLENFRCFKHLDMDLDPKFNMIVGINGTGKTAVLEAIRIAIGSLFLDVDKYRDKIWSPGIEADDVRLSHLEQQYPVKVIASAEIEEITSDKNFLFKKDVSWERTLDGKGGRTTQINAKEMKALSSALQKKIRDNDNSTPIPLIAYYSTDRFKKEKKDVGIENDGSRLRGYYNALDPLTNIKFFLDLYFTETLSTLQNRTSSPMLAAVNSAVVICIEDCSNLVFDIKQSKLMIQLKSIKDQLPFHVLSDGVRSTLAMVMEIAFRCYLLNPHLKENAALDTPGIILIDEVDLHLHPAWQKKVIGDLRKAFPKMQFIVTTHAPLVIGSLTDGKIFSISDSTAYEFPLQYGMDANSIINEMGTDEMNKDIKDSLNKYFLLIESGHGKEDKAIGLRAALEKTLGKDHTELQRADMLLNFF